MTEAFRGLMMLEQRYNLTGEKRKTIHEGKSLYENVIDVGLKTNDTKNELYKRHALSNERGLDYTRGIKDIKTFNSNMPDVLRRLDFYFNEENKTIMPITPIDLETEQVIHRNEEKEGRKLSTERKEEIKSQVKEEYKGINTDTSKLKSGKGKSIFTSVDSPQTDSSNEMKDDEEKMENEDDDEESSYNYKPSQEQEDKFNDFMKEATDDTSKRFGLIIIEKDGNIKKHYKSITEFKDDEMNFDKFNTTIGADFKISQRKSGTSYISVDGDALYFVPLKTYREHYETRTYLRRNKKLKKKKENENEKL